MDKDSPTRISHNYDAFNKHIHEMSEREHELTRAVRFENYKKFAIIMIIASIALCAIILCIGWAIKESRTITSKEIISGEPILKLKLDDSNLKVLTEAVNNKSESINLVLDENTIKVLKDVNNNQRNFSGLPNRVVQNIKQEEKSQKNSGFEQSVVQFQSIESGLDFTGPVMTGWTYNDPANETRIPDEIHCYVIVINQNQKISVDLIEISPIDKPNYVGYTNYNLTRMTEKQFYSLRNKCTLF